MPHVMVGDEKVKVNWGEYLAARLPDGSPVEWTERHLLTGKVDKGTGILKFTSFYDGVVAHVDTGYGSTRRIFLDSRDCRVRRLRGVLVGEGCQGDGI